MDGTIDLGDMVVCRVNGTSELYVVGTVDAGVVGELSLRGVSTTIGRSLALGHAYEHRLPHQRVWLFDGAARGYVKTSRPAA